MSNQHNALWAQSTSTIPASTVHHSQILIPQIKPLISPINALAYPDMCGLRQIQCAHLSPIKVNPQILPQILHHHPIQQVIILPIQIYLLIVPYQIVTNANLGYV